MFHVQSIVVVKVKEVKEEEEEEEEEEEDFDFSLYYDILHVHVILTYSLPALWCFCTRKCHRLSVRT